MQAIGLTLGPVLFNWSADRLADFYRRVADEGDFDRVHIGEVVCGKRMPFSDRAWPEIIERLEAAGKEVVLSTLALPATARDRKAMEELCADDRLVEVNDITALPFRAGRPFVAGPFLNIYNEDSAAFLVARGARMICAPVELPLATIGAMAAHCPDAAMEVFAFGRLPLALSGRCYHARIHGLHKDSCQFICDRDLDGLPVDTLDGQRFLAVNGIQTLSHGIQAFCPSPAVLAGAGIARLRLSPHTADMIAVGSIYRQLVNGRIAPEEAWARLSGMDLPGALVDGYLRGLRGVAPPAFS